MSRTWSEGIGGGRDGTEHAAAVIDVTVVPVTEHPMVGVHVAEAHDVVVVEPAEFVPKLQT